MALTGNIEVFPLPEVLRLLARSGKNGCLRVDAAGVDGRIYLHQGALSLATVSSDLDLADQIASSGVVERSQIEGRDTVDLADAIASGRSTDDLSDLIREHVVESLYRIRRPGSGTFEFLVDAESRFRTGQSFDAEQIVAEADRRAADWSDIEQTISDMYLPVRMVRELSEPEVSVNAPTWRVLASLEGGSSVADIARLLGTTEFRAAREVASLIRSSLIEPVGVAMPPQPEIQPEFQPAPQPEIQPQPESFQPESPQPESSRSSGSWFSAPVDTGNDTGEPTVEGAADDASEPDATPSPWATAQDDPQPSQEWTDPWSRPAEATQEPTAAPEEAPAESSQTRGGWWAEAMGAADEMGDVDTDEFLESVFSEADGRSVDNEEESGFSMGLLRRRRMGPVARDVTSSD
jgi:hypothetical protein